MKSIVRDIEDILYTISTWILSISGFIVIVLFEVIVVDFKFL